MNAGQNSGWHNFLMAIAPGIPMLIAAVIVLIYVIWLFRNEK